MFAWCWQIACCQRSKHYAVIITVYVALAGKTGHMQCEQQQQPSYSSGASISFGYFLRPATESSPGRQALLQVDSGSQKLPID